MSWETVGAAGGVVAVLATFLAWLRGRLMSGDIVVTLESRSGRKLKARAEAAAAALEAEKEARHEAERCARCAEQRVDDWQNRYIRRLEGQVNGEDKGCH